MAVVKVPERFDIFLLSLDPALGSEIQKTRPCIVISPNEMNSYINTVIIAPMTTGSRPYPTRVAVNFKSKRGQIVLDQIRTVDRIRLVQHLGKLDASTSKNVLQTLAKMFAP